MRERISAIRAPALILLLSILLAAPIAADEPGQEKKPAEIRLQVVGGRTINVFAGPGVGFPILRVVGKDETLTPCGKKFSWYLVCLEDGTRGYVFDHWVREVLAQPEPKVEEFLEKDAGRQLLPPAGAPEAAKARPVIEEVPPEKPPAPGKGGGTKKPLHPEKPQPEAPETVPGGSEAIAPKPAAANPQEAKEAEKEAEEWPAPEQGELLYRIPLEDMDLLRLGRVMRSDPDPNRRIQAVKLLGTRGVIAVPVLMDGLKHGQEYVQIEAARQLGNVGGPAAKQGLAEALVRGSTPLEAKKAVAETLAAMGDPSVLDLLKAQLARAVDPDYHEVLSRAIQRLEKKE